MWVEEGEGACPAVYRPVSVDDEETGLRGKLGRAEEKQPAGLSSKLRIYIFCLSNGDLAGHD